MNQNQRPGSADIAVLKPFAMPLQASGARQGHHSWWRQCSDPQYNAGSFRSNTNHFRLAASRYHLIRHHQSNQNTTKADGRLHGQIRNVYFIRGGLSVRPFEETDTKTLHTGKGGKRSWVAPYYTTHKMLRVTRV